MWVGMVRGGHSSGGPADLETLRKETRLEIQLEKLPGGVWLKAHWEVRLAAVHVEAQREEARYTVLGPLQPLRQPQLQFLGLYRPQHRQKPQGLLLKCHFCGCLWMCGLKHLGNPVLRFNPRFS